MSQHRWRLDFLPLSGRRQWQIVLFTVLRLVIILAVSFTVYFLLPVDGFARYSPLTAWLRLSAIVLLFLVTLGFQIRAILDAEIPLLRAIEAIAECIVVFVLLYSALHLSISSSDPAAFSEPLEHIDALYFTTTTFSTVGFGDIVAVTPLARAVVTLQMITGLGILAMVAKVAFLAAQFSVSRKRQ